MRTAGYALGSSLLFVLALNIGGIVGTIAASWPADRVGIKPVAAGASAVATLSILLLSVNFPLALLMLAVAGRALAAELLESEVSWHRPTRP